MLLTILVSPALLAGLSFSPSVPVQEPAAEVSDSWSDAEPALLERSGTLVPSDGMEIQLWLAEFSGELLLLEVAEHGASVEEGDVVAVLDRRAIDRQIDDARFDLQSAEIAHANATEQAEIDAEASEERLASSRAELERAQRALDGWMEFEVAFRKRSEELSAMRTEHGIEDASDELDQLEAMYREDELTDATEDIVLKRSRRNLARSKTSQALSADRRAYAEEFTHPMERERREESLAKMHSALHRQVRTEAIAERTRVNRLERSGRELRKKAERYEGLVADREAFVIRAPRAGVVLHGSPEDYEPGKASPRHERGTRASQQTTLFTIAHPDRFRIAFDVPESELAQLRDGMGAIVTTTVSGDEYDARIRLDRFPTPRSASGSENLYAASAAVDAEMAGLVAGMRVTVGLRREIAE